MERILSDLFRRFGNPEQPIEDSEHDPAVPVIELAESIRVARGDPNKECSIFTSLVAGYDIA